MKTLYLLRHAKSSWKDIVLDDFDRPLSKRGRRAAEAMGLWLAREKIMPAQVLCSSSKRTRETLDHIQRALDAAMPARFEKGIYLAEASALLRRLRRLNDSLGSAMLIGHNPGLQQLALLLTQEADNDDDARQQLAAKFSTGSLAVIDADVTRWTDLQPACGHLRSFTKPGDLREA